MKKIFVFVILLLFLVNSCVNQEKPNFMFENVPLIINIDSVEADTLKVNCLKYIPLETSDECIIGNYSKELIRNQKIYVADFHMAMAIFVFDMNGKFIFKISERGQGPNEYVSIKDFDIDSNGEIYIYDSHGKKFVVFSSEGKFVRKIPIDYFFSSFCLMNNKMYWSKLYQSGIMIANLAVYDVVDNKTDFLMNEEKELHPTNLLNNRSYDFFYSPDSIVYFSPKFSELIYSIDNEGVHPAIGLKNLKIPPKEMIEDWSKTRDVFESIRLMDESGYFIESVDVFETDQYVTFSPIRHVFTDILLYNKMSASICKIDGFNITKTIGINSISGSTGRDFFGVITYKLENEFQKRIIASRKELENWNEEDNAVIAIFNFDN